MLNRFVSTILGLLIAVIFSLAGVVVIKSGFNSIQELRQLERISLTKATAVLPGETQVRGIVVAAKGELTSYYTKTPCVYYRYTHEIEQRDSEGNRSWKLVEKRQQSRNFVLLDDSGEIQLLAGNQGESIEWELAPQLAKIQGDHRFTEWRISQGETVSAFGKAILQDNRIALSFTEPGFYTPIITTFASNIVKTKFGSLGLLLLWGGLLCLTMAAYGLTIALRIHRVLVFLVLITAFTSITLLYLSADMLREDLKNGAAGYQSQWQAATHIFNQQFPTQSQESTLEIPASLEDENLINKFHYIRLQLANSHRQLADQMNRFPEKYLLGFWGIEQPHHTIKLSDYEQTLNHALNANIQKTRLNKGLYSIAIALATVICLALTWLGLRFIKVKRLIENIPTSRIQGLSPGISEITGIAKSDVEPLRGPLSGMACYWYFYHVQEQTGSGKNKRWRTLEKETRFVPFLCEDDTGSIEIDCRGAEIISKTTTKKRQGRMSYTESRLGMSDYLYILGTAEIDAKHADRLHIAKGKNAGPFIVSNQEEDQLLLRKAGHGILSLLGAFAAALAIGLFGFGVYGYFDAYDIFRSALAGPLYLMALMFMLHYNDLIFLRERAQRNFANIQTALKKRSNLIPRLLALAKRFAQHEKQLQTHVTQLRAAMNPPDITQKNLEDCIHSSALLNKQLQLTAETYPDLQTDKIMGDFSKSLAQMENELAYLRKAHIDAVTVYNTRCQTFPDIIFARLFGFKRLTL